MGTDCLPDTRRRAEGNTWKGKISSDGVDLQTKVMRFVKITFTVEDSGERKIMVESVESDR